ncbi:chromosome-associated kinesin KIF4 [Contarinia nasturtii]|uniref:chromosome-associated kinesin KIF4 n=1 Tax=Contarinia nasturtii TaxID=265458 RepID=UPI0012D484C7|nr:chromosome-associated kinesin KIF4 [Contarinia nasturtii]
MSSDDTVKVAVRIRPLVKSEKDRGCQSIVHKTATHPQVIVNTGTKTSDKYTYNYVFSPEDSQEMIYDNAVRSMVFKLFEGFNVTILAYGQTGSGKTHTMGTNYNSNGDIDEVGVIPRAVNEIFEQITTMEIDNDFTVNCSFVELYQEKLYDLLTTNQRDQSIVDIREVDGKIVIPNLTERIVKDTVSTTKCLMDGSSFRAVGATAMNAQSSRSHAIFTVTIQKIPKEDPASATIAKFHLVDLAGSERSKKTQAVGEQFKEGVKINQGLLALGNVISALGSTNPNDNKHIGYRDSKLTRLLQDSLGGNSITLMIACVSPADYNCDETIGTLRYADRARKIKNKPIVNEDPKTAEINRLKAEIQSLRVELLSKSGIGNMTSVEKCKSCQEPPTKAQLQKDNRELAEKMQMALFEMAHRENVLTEYEETIESLNAKITELKGQIDKLDKENTTNMSPEQLKQYEEKVQMITTSILDLTEHMKERNDCIIQNLKHTESQSINVSRSSLADSEELAQTNDKYIKQQTEYQQELREFKQELNVKEKLHYKLIENYEKFRSLNDAENVKAKMKEYEEMIKKMEKEQEELKLALRNKNGSVSVKLAEERRKRVQLLEAQIAEIKQKNNVQAKLLKQHEKDGDQIKKLSSEIVEMKQNKVKLIKKMKFESDEFRQWKAQREKEIVQLRTKERKLESEAVKKDLLHEKQRIVLQRKFEESNAANKRLKEALLKVQKNKESKLANKNAPAQKAAWLNEEIELISSIVDIKQSYERLNDARAELTTRLNKAKRRKDKELVKQTEEEIEMHNAQITDLREKIRTNDLDEKIKAIQDSYQTLPESRSIVRHLLNTFVENRGNFNTYFAQARDMKHQIDALHEEKQQMADEFKRKSDDLQNEMKRLVDENVEKQSVLLKALASEGSQSELIALLQAQLNEKEAEIEQIRDSKLIYKRPIKQRIEEVTIELDDTMESVNVDDDDESMDPDWVKTPLQKWSRRKTTRLNSQNSQGSENESIMEPIPKPSKPAPKRSKSSKGVCGCKTGCKEGHCGCRRSGNSCNDSCGCVTLKNCTNVFGRDSAGSLKRGRSIDEDNNTISVDEEDKENLDEVVPCTPPKKLRTDDIINPYVYSHKKRHPIFTAPSQDD